MKQVVGRIGAAPGARHELRVRTRRGDRRRRREHEPGPVGWIDRRVEALLPARIDELGVAALRERLVVGQDEGAGEPRRDGRAGGRLARHELSMRLHGNGAGQRRHHRGEGGQAREAASESGHGPECRQCQAGMSSPPRCYDDATREGARRGADAGLGRHVRRTGARDWTRHVQRAGVLRGVRGIVLGDFPGCAPDPGAGYALRDVVADRLGDLGVPVLYGVPFGHTPRPNPTLPLGVRATLDATRRTLTLEEAGVR